MKIYRYKNSNGDWIRSISPKPTKEEKELAEGIIGLICVLVFIVCFVYLIFNS